MVESKMPGVKETPLSNQQNTTISAKKVCVRFGQVVALSGFSVNIPKGIVGLLGPNGSGKSTFIKTALGLVQSQSGSIRIDGHDPVTEMLTVRDMIGYMPEHDCLIGSKNAVELVSYMAQLSGMTKKDSIQRTHEVLDFVSVGEERYRKISSYSTGMMQRIKLAQAIVHDPPILFLDEPTNGMDPQGREDMLALVKKIGASDKSLLVSSHILHEVEKVSDYAIIIRDGALVMEGTIESLIAGEKGIFSVLVRGIPAQLEAFVSKLSSKYKLISTQRESGQVTCVIRNEGPSSPIFKLASSKSVQIRAYRPETLSLEDVFIKALDVSSKTPSSAALGQPKVKGGGA